MSLLCFIHIVSTFKMGRGSSEATEHLPSMGRVLSRIHGTTFKMLNDYTGQYTNT